MTNVLPFPKVAMRAPTTADKVAFARITRQYNDVAATIADWMVEEAHNPFLNQLIAKYMESISKLSSEGQVILNMRRGQQDDR